MGLLIVPKVNKCLFIRSERIFSSDLPILFIGEDQLEPQGSDQDRISTSSDYSGAHHNQILFSMSCIINPLFPTPAMALRLKRDVINTPYTTDSPILGQVILEPRAPLDISQITITLSGMSISRKSGSKQSQCYQVSIRSAHFHGKDILILSLSQFLRKQQQILPQSRQFDFSKSSSNSKSLTMGAKTYIFPFSIAV